MGTKNISLRESAYQRLASLKREGESFSDVVERLTKDRTPKYADLAGLLSDETIKAIEKTTKERRKADKKRFRKIAERFQGDKE